MISSIKAKKKGLIALEALIGTIVSVVALVFLFEVFSNIVFSTPDNFKIVKDNSKSIYDFLNYPENNNMDTYNNCFFTLKLNHLQNFQYEEEGENYFYIIKEDGIYYSDLLNLESFEKNYIENKVFENVKKLENFESLNILRDITKSPWSISVDFDFDNGDTFVNLEDVDDYFLLMIPILSSNQNEFQIKEFFDNDFETLLTSNLYYSNNFQGTKKVLFFPRDSYTDILVSDNLCSKKYLFEVINMDRFTEDINLADSDSRALIDYNNMKITYNIPINNVFVKIIYENSKISCPDIDCSNIFDLNKIISFRDFQKELNNKVDVGDKIQDINTYFVSAEESNLNSNYVFFEDFRILMDKNNNYEEFNFQNILGFNTNINECDEDKCNLIFFQNGRMFFMINSVSNLDYFAFYEHVFRKDNNQGLIPTKVNLGNKEYNVKEKEIDGEGFFDEDKEIYIIENVEMYLDVKNKIVFDLYLTKSQLKLIPSYSDRSEFKLVGGNSN